MKLITERNLLYAYTPLDIHNPHKKNFSLPFSDNGTTVCDQYWGAREYMLIDILGDTLRKYAYKNSKPKRSVLKQFISRLDSNTVKTNFTENKVEPNQITSFEISFSYVRRSYPFFKKYGPQKFYQLVEKTSNIGLICDYKYKINHTQSDYNWDTKKSKTKEQISKIDFKPKIPQRLFEFDYFPSNKTYKIHFSSGLGALYANNILAAEWEWLPFKFFELSKSAQNLYRKFVLVKKKDSEIRISEYLIANTLKLTTPNQTTRRKAIERLLGELVKIGFISFEIERGYKERIYSIKKLISN